MTIIASPPQRAVVEYPLAPLRVTAGAGTGKTTTMALRLSALIHDGSVEPEAALGITFTNKAAGELADRLRRLLPDLSRSGREVEVATYHGFAYGLLREFGPILGIERGAAVITPGYARQLLRDALGEAPRATLDLTMPGARVDELVGLAGRLGDHLRTTDDLRAHAGGDDVDAQRLEMADVLDAYARRKAALGVLDYSDLITGAFRLVDGHPEVALRIRSRYRVVLLDEYQDTNPAQREVLRRVFGGGFPVTAVGDPDQTIYEWRGASLENFAAFPVHFAADPQTPADTLPLAENRRSARRIIDVANDVRHRLRTGPGLDRLEPLEHAPVGDVTVARLHDAVGEARWIAREIVRLHDEESIAWRDVGVLFRRHRQMGLVRDALERHGVPVEVAALGGLLEVPEVADLHAWLRVLGRPDDAPALLRILLGVRYRLGLGDLAPLARCLRSRRAAAPSEPAGSQPTLLEVIDDLEACKGVTAETRHRLVRFRSEYRELLQAAQAVSLVELCRRILDATSAWPEIEALPPAARMTARLNLYRFLDLAEAWSPLEGAPSLEAFNDYLDLLADDRATDELDTARISGEDAVTLLTAHRAKGLEWPVVVLPALVDQVFPSRPRRLEDPAAAAQFLPEVLRLDADWWPKLPEEPAARTEELRRRHADQEWRVAYVAVTRAAVRLIATCAHWYTDRTARSPSPLFDIIASAPGALRHDWIEDPGEPPELLRIGDPPTADSDATFPSGWWEALRGAVADPEAPRRRAGELGIVASYDAAVDQLRITLDDLARPAPEQDPEPAPVKTSVTGLVTYATCPQQFVWSQVDRLPRRPTAARRRGVDLHRRIELHNRGIASLEEADETFYDLGVSDAGEAPGPDDPSGFEAFASSRFAVERPKLVEAPFELLLGDARIAGRIDAVYEPEPGLWDVVDFKSGSRRDHPAAITQLEAYALAALEAGLAPSPPQRTRVSFVYLGGGVEVVTTDVDEPWLDRARDHLRGLVDGIAEARFDAAPSAACRRCDFLRFCDAGAAWTAAQEAEASRRGPSMR